MNITDIKLFLSRNTSLNILDKMATKSGWQFFFYVSKDHVIFESVVFGKQMLFEKIENIELCDIYANLSEEEEEDLFGKIMFYKKYVTI